MSDKSPSRGAKAPTDTPVRIVRCPNCQGDSVYAPSNPYRPFCGARCKGMDFGAWADESFRLAAHSEPDELAPPDQQLQ